MKKLILSLFAGMLVIHSQGQGAAQELLISPEGMETVGVEPDLALPPESGEGSSVQSDSTTLPTDSWDMPHDQNTGHMYLCDPALLESTGTWLRRGYWYAEADAMIYNRKWSRIPVTLGQQQTGFNTGNGPTQPLAFRNHFNKLRIEPYDPGAEGAPRFTLGHFLFRDQMNRDHVMEFTAFGGGQWTQMGSLDANPNNDLGTLVLEVPEPTDRGNLSFDNADTMNFRYDGRFNSFELNYLVKDRMGRDRLELEPSGHWIRRADTSTSRFFLAGVRFLDVSDDFVWSASGIDPDGDASTDDNVDDDNGTARIKTDNDMIGTQVGFGSTYETARWSAGVECKGGMFLNIVDVGTSFTRTQNLSGNDIQQNSSLDTDELSFLGEAALIGKWHLRPNFSIRASLEVLFATSNAFAPSQLAGPFIPGGPPSIDTGGETTLLGGGIGFEGYW